MGGYTVLLGVAASSPTGRKLEFDMIYDMIYHMIYDMIYDTVYDICYDMI